LTDSNRKNFPENAESLEGAEMNFVQPELSFTRPDRQRSTDIREELNASNIIIETEDSRKKPVAVVKRYWTT
jgi:hypothetical protein